MLGLLTVIQKAPEIVEVVIKENYSLNEVWEHPLLSGMLGAIFGSVITILGTIFIQKILITHERQIRFKEEQMKALAHLKQFFNSKHYREEDKGNRRFIVDAKHSEEIIIELNNKYIYLPKEVANNLDSVITFSQNHLYDGFPSEEFKELYEVVNIGVKILNNNGLKFPTYPR